MTPKAPGRPVSMPAYHLLLRTTAGPVTRSSPAAHGRSGGFPSHCGVRFCKASPCKWTCSRLSGSAAPDEANCRVSLRRGRAGEERRQTSWSRKQPPPTLPAKIGSSQSGGRKEMNSATNRSESGGRVFSTRASGRAAARLTPPLQLQETLKGRCQGSRARAPDPETLR